MHRTQISLEPDQHRLLGEEARRRGLSLAALIRTLVDQHLARAEPPPEDPLEALVGIGKGGGDPFGREHNRHLYGEDRR
jgi:hypothetical protein